MNKYKELYDNLINFRLQNKITKENCYCESHHITPIKLGGSDTEDNLVNLLPEEHFKAHVYLCLYYKSINDIESYNKMISVPILMVGNRRYGINKIVLNLNNLALQYAELRKDYSNYRKQHSPNFGKRQVHNNFLNKNEFIDKDATLPENYSEGWVYSEKYHKIHSDSIIKRNKEHHPFKNKIIIYNLKTFEVKHIKKNEIIPDGWVRGYKMNKSNKTIWIHNPITKETKMIGENDNIPEGFIRGRGKFSEEQKKNYKGRIPWNKGLKK